MVEGVEGEEATSACPCSLLLRVMPCFNSVTGVLRNGFLSGDHTLLWLWFACSSNLSEGVLLSQSSGGTWWCLCIEKQSSPSARVLVSVLESGEFTNERSSPPAHNGTCDSNTFLPL